MLWLYDNNIWDLRIPPRNKHMIISSYNIFKTSDSSLWRYALYRDSQHYQSKGERNMVNLHFAPQVVTLHYQPLPNKRKGGRVNSVMPITIIYCRYFISACKHFVLFCREQLCKEMLTAWQYKVRELIIEADENSMSTCHQGGWHPPSFPDVTVWLEQTTHFINN